MANTADDVVMTHDDDENFENFGVPDFHNFGEDESVTEDGDNDDSFFGEERRSSVLPDSNLAAPEPTTAAKTNENDNIELSDAPVAQMDAESPVDPVQVVEADPPAPPSMSEPTEAVPDEEEAQQPIAKSEETHIQKEEKKDTQGSAADEAPSTVAPAAKSPAQRRKSRRPSTGGYMSATKASSARKEAAARRRLSRSASPGPAKRLSLTKPTAPSFMNRASTRRSNDVRKSSTTLELEKIKMGRKKMQQRKRQYDTFRKTAGSTIGTAQQPKPLTIPAELPERLRPAKKLCCEPSPMKPSAHPMALRSRGTTSKSGPLKLTRPEAPKFHTTSKAGPVTLQNAPKVKTQAELLAEMHGPTSVPHRLHSKPTNRNVGTPQPKRKLALTRPEGPKFHSTKPKVTKEHVLTTEEREIEAMKKIQPFKARPVSAAVMASSGDQGVPKVPKRELTRPKAFTFNTQKQAVKRAAAEHGTESASDQTAAPTFTARKFTNPKPFTLTKEVFQPTMTQSPKLATKSRASARPTTVPTKSDAEPQHQFKARPMPKDEAPVPHPVQTRALTEPKPFNMPGEALRAQKDAKREAELQREEQEAAEARKFKARQSIATKTKPFVPKPSEKALTEQVAFNLESVNRHELFKAEQTEHIAQQLSNAQSAMKFHAAAIPSSHTEPMKVAASEKQLTQPIDCVQNSALQAMERRAFDDEARKHRADKMAAELEVAKKKAADEAAEVQRMRKEHMSFKAAPVRHFRDVTNTVEQAELTLPKTPKLATRARAEQNAHALPEPSYGC